MTFQMEQNGMFLENSKNDYLMLHKSYSKMIVSLLFIFHIFLRPYYTMHWVCVLVRFMSKTRAKRGQDEGKTRAKRDQNATKTQLTRVLPNAQCNIETFSRVGLAFWIFLGFFLHFSCEKTA